MNTRTAFIPHRFGTDVSTERIRAFLPSNYSVSFQPDINGWLIEGQDNAGWTLDGYVIPRLASGSIFATEQV